MRRFELYTATDARHAVALLAEHGAGARVLAGGTDLLVELKDGADEAPCAVVDISRVADLKRIEATPAGLRIGALVTHADLLRSPLVRELCPALATAARTVGAVQTRNLGTLGGNLVSAVPSMDGGPTLAALDATLAIATPEGVRELALDAFFLGPRRTALRQGELLTHVLVPARNLRKPAHFLKFGLRKGQALALVNVAAAFRVAGAVFDDVRIALGAVAPTVVRARAAETFLERRTISPEAMDQAAAIAAGECRPINDFRASADYRRTLVTVLVKRALTAVWEQAVAEEAPAPS